MDIIFSIIDHYDNFVCNKIHVSDSVFVLDINIFHYILLTLIEAHQENEVTHKR